MLNVDSNGFENVFLFLEDKTTKEFNLFNDRQFMRTGIRKINVDVSSNIRPPHFTAIFFNELLSRFEMFVYE